MDGETMMDMLAAAGREPFGYAGRAMFGRRCVAVRLSSVGELFRLGVDLASAASAAGSDRPPTPRTETLGMGVVVYWEELDWPD